MTAKDILKSASTDLTSFMDDYGYMIGRLAGRFVRSTDKLDKRITFTVCKWSNGNGYHIDHYCEYRLPEYTDVHNKYLPYRTDKDKKLAPTISEYFFNLLPREFDWHEVTIANESDISPVVRNIERICTSHSFPFLDRFDTAEEIVKGFCGERSCWVIQDPILRFQLLLIDCVLKQNPRTFDDWFEQTKRFCGNRKDGQAVGLLELAMSLKSDYFP